MFSSLHQLFTIFSILTILAFSSPIDLEPVHGRALVKRLPLVQCNEEQTQRLESVFQQLSGYALLPVTWLAGTEDGFPYNERKKAFSHYFKPDDKDIVKKAFEVFINAAVVQGFFNIRCASGAEAECSGAGFSSFAFAQPWPEDMEVPDQITPGQRQLVICPLFWEDERTKRDLPRDDATTKEFCQFKESKRYKDWETGAHTLLHEISHLDEFGKAAGFSELTIPEFNGIPEFNAHGTDDWAGKSTPYNARILRNSKREDLIPRVQNAESLAAFSLELFVDKYCGVLDVSL